MDQNPYMPHINFITAGKVAESAYMLSREGAFCASSLGIQEMYRYELEVEDNEKQGVMHKIVMDERLAVMDAIAHEGVCKLPGGLRLCNEKYYSVHADVEKQTYYFKKSKGGACIALSEKFILIGTWNSEVQMQNKVPQNAGELNKRVETLVATLKKDKN